MKTTTSYDLDVVCTETAEKRFVIKNKCLAILYN